MSKGFEKLHIKSAVRSRSNVKLEKYNLTTQNFGEICPLTCLELVPSDKITSMSINTFARLAPMVVPTYSSMFFKTAAYFVPYHQIMDGADAYIAGQRYSMGNLLYMRYITLEDLVDYFTSKSTISTSSNYDWKYINSSGDTVYMKLTEIGKYGYKVLKGLGYEIPRGINNNATSGSWLTKMKTFKLSAFPLLCFAKVYCDWMMNNQRYHSEALTQALYNIKTNQDAGSTVYSADGHVSYGFIDLLISGLRLNYETDYFTSAWQSPNTPLDGMPLIGNMPYFNSNSESTLFNDVKNVTLPVTVSSGVAGINQRALDYLSRFNDWVRRNSFVSTKDTEQILAKFGVKIDDYKVRFAYRLGSSSTPIQVGDVTATANSSIGGVEVPIGDYVGKGILSGSHQGVDFTSSDYGMLVVMSWITPRVSYSQGFDHSVLRINPTDFYSPEFDDMQASPISVMEVAQCNKTQANASMDDGSKVFGFVPKYSDYLYSRDVVSGDMILSEGYEAWHFNRDFSSMLNNNQVVAQSVAMNQMMSTDSEYNRIFTITDGLEDKFILTSKIEVKMNRPMKSLSAKADLGEGNLIVDRNGSQVS